MPWKTWADVPEAPDLGKNWFLEVFSGTARLTMAVLLNTVLWALPPIDFDTSTLVRASFDVLTSPHIPKVLRWLASGAIVALHFGTPCTTFSAARRWDDGGPTPLRDLANLYGFTGLSAGDLQKIQDGNAFLRLTSEWIQATPMATIWSLENPATILLWHTEEVL